MEYGKVALASVSIRPRKAYALQLAYGIAYHHLLGGCNIVYRNRAIGIRRYRKGAPTEFSTRQMAFKDFRRIY